MENLDLLYRGKRDIVAALTKKEKPDPGIQPIEEEKPNTGVLLNIDILPIEEEKSGITVSLDTSVPPNTDAPSNISISPDTGAALTEEEKTDPVAL